MAAEMLLLPLLLPRCLAPLVLFLHPQAIGPDVEFVLSRAQAIQQEQSARIMTVEHLNDALGGLPGSSGGGGVPLAASGGNAESLTKADLEATMKQMLMASVLHCCNACRLQWHAWTHAAALFCACLLARC